jgi:predicted esterase
LKKNNHPEAEEFMKKKLVFLLFILTAIIRPVKADVTDLENYGKLVEFKMIDHLGDERDVRVFIPHNCDYEAPTKAVWYFRGLNGINTTWNIETTRLYKTGYEEKAVIIAPDLFQKTWSKGSDETDFYLVKDIIEKLQTLKGDNDRSVNLDLNNMSAIGFSAGGGFIYHLAGKYPLIFNEIRFRKYISHAKHSDDFDDLKAAYNLFPDDRPPFFLSAGTNDHTSGNKAELMVKTRDDLVRLGFEVTLYIVPGMRHQFNMDFSPDFKKNVKDFLFPVRITEPGAKAVWHVKPGSGFPVKWTSELTKTKSFNMDMCSLAGDRSFQVASNIPDTGSCTITPDPQSVTSGTYFIRLKSVDKMDIAYSPAFQLVAYPLTLTLNITRKEDSAWVITREYGEIDLSVVNMTSGWVSKFVVYRKEGNGGYLSIKEIPAAELAGESCKFQDRYLKRNEIYTYKAEALDASGRVLAVSEETPLSPGTGAAAKIITRFPGTPGHKGETR